MLLLVGWADAQALPRHPDKLEFAERTLHFPERAGYRHELATGDVAFVVEDLHNFGADYDKTLCAWMEKFDDHWPKLAEKYDERFYRMWRYYLLSCAGAFRGRWIQLWQLVLSKHGVAGGYTTVR